MKTQIFKISGSSGNGSLLISEVRGREILIPEEIERLFYVYKSEEGIWHFNEGSTGVSLSQSEISEDDVVNKARNIIRKAKKEGRFHQKLHKYYDIMKDCEISVPLNTKQHKKALCYT